MNIYRYDDYRLFLKDRFGELQAEDHSLTHRVFAEKAGFSNPGFLNDIIKGRRKLSKEARLKMAHGMQLTPHESDFFMLLVEFGQTNKEEQKEELYRKICFRRGRSSFARLSPEKSRYYEDYRYPLIRSEKPRLHPSPTTTYHQKPQHHDKNR